MFYLRFYLKVRFVLWSVVDFVVDFLYIYIKYIYIKKEPLTRLRRLMFL